VPRDVWLRLSGLAKREVGILACSGLFLAEDPSILDTLADRARAGVRVRVCIRDPVTLDVPESAVGQGNDDMQAAPVWEALVRYGPLRENGGAEIRLHREVIYNSTYRADDEFLVSQHVYGVPAERAPVLYLRRADGADMATAYLESFERIWASARPVE
jgi:hypothetical protein